MAQLKQDAQTMTDSWSAMIDSAEDTEATQMFKDKNKVQDGRESLAEAGEVMRSMAADVIQNLESGSL